MSNIQFAGDKTVCSAADHLHPMVEESHMEMFTIFCCFFYFGPTIYRGTTSFNLNSELNVV